VLQVTVSIRGGLMDDDRVTSIRGDQLTIMDRGKIRGRRRLPPGDVDQLERLASEVARLTMPSRKPPIAVDGGTTTIEIAAGQTKRIELSAGEDAPEPVWELLYLVDGLSRDTKIRR
jgi:hypothetical protein